MKKIKDSNKVDKKPKAFKVTRNKTSNQRILTAEGWRRQLMQKRKEQEK